MRVTAVESTTLATVACDQALTMLQLEFCSGAVYQYCDVPDGVHQALLQSSSKGSYFNQTIRSRFSYSRIRSRHATDPDSEVAAACHP